MKEDIKKFYKGELDEEIKLILHDRGRFYDDLKILTKALSSKAKVPEKYWDPDADDSLIGFLGIKAAIPKDDLREIKDMIISEVIHNLERDDLQMDNYTRLFHCLTMLKVYKTSEIVPVTRLNHNYNAAYFLWALDSEDKWRYVNSVAWYASEAVKGSDPCCLVPGLKI